MNEMERKICVVTGSNSGIGKETALALAGKGATVVMAVRSREKGEATIQEILKEIPDASLDLMICDVSSRKSIEDFVEEFTGKYSRLEVLVNNAGAEFGRRQTTRDGFESSFAVNYLGPFLLTQKLLPTLSRSIPSRIINLSSGLHKQGHVDFNDLQSEKRYAGMKAYSNAKLMVLLWTYELSRRLQGSGVSVNAVQPGFAATNLGRNSGNLMQSVMFSLVRPMQTTAKKAAETSVYVASSPEVEGITGKCFAGSKEVASSPESYDVEEQKRLWDITVRMLNLPEY